MTINKALQHLSAAFGLSVAISAVQAASFTPLGDHVEMPSAATSNSAFASLGEEFCWHARNFAAMYNGEHVDTVGLQFDDVLACESYERPRRNGWRCDQR